MADPGFPRGGGAKPRGGAPSYYLANFPRKLHENEEISGRGARGTRPPLDPPLTINTVQTSLFVFVRRCKVNQFRALLACVPRNFVIVHTNYGTTIRVKVFLTRRYLLGNAS